MTKSALEFITPLTFETFTGKRVYTDMFNYDFDPLAHISLGKNSELILIAPASANIIGKAAGGIADDLLSTIIVAFNKKIVIAPSMNTNMLENPIVVENMNKLKKRGIMIIEPEIGSLACKEEGKGRLPSADKIYKFCMESYHV